MLRRSLSILGALACTSCAPSVDHEIAEPIAANSWTASLLAVDADAPTGPLSLYGTALVVVDGKKATLRLDTVLPGKAEYGMHLHAIGKCDPPDFASAGAHWNPSAKHHGRDNPAGSHDGDLPNIRATEVSGTYAVVEQQIDLNIPDIAKLFDADGASIIIHEKADDYMSDPSGNSGKRIICGVFKRN